MKEILRHVQSQKRLHIFFGELLLQNGHRKKGGSKKLMAKGFPRTTNERKCQAESCGSGL